MVREAIPWMRLRLTKQEAELGIHLRGNERLYTALVDLIETRIEARAALPEPSEPLVCKSMMAKDRELRWLLSRLAFVYKSPPGTPADTPSEQPDE